MEATILFEMIAQTTLASDGHKGQRFLTSASLASFYEGWLYSVVHGFSKAHFFHMHAYSIECVLACMHTAELYENGNAGT